MCVRPRVYFPVHVTPRVTLIIIIVGRSVRLENRRRRSARNGHRVGDGRTHEYAENETGVKNDYVLVVRITKNTRFTFVSVVVIARAQRKQKTVTKCERNRPTYLL